ncbi:MAG: hypothetical protein KGI08_09260 [Thaumarchaeota archaeon]|nr:hypothetical protein [Nitrososphaerota archaeon]
MNYLPTIILKIYTDKGIERLETKKRKKFTLHVREFNARLARRFHLRVLYGKYQGSTVFNDAFADTKKELMEIFEAFYDKDLWLNSKYWTAGI